MSSTPKLIAELVQRLDPVRPIPRLRVVVRNALLLWLALAGALFLLAGPRQDLAEVATGGAAFLAIVAGLALLGLGGVASALALGVPGRTATLRLGLGLALVGTLVSAGLGSGLVLRGAAWGRAIWLDPADLACLGRACLFAVPTGLAILAFLARAAPLRRLHAVLCTAVGAVALGAVLVHATCAEGATRHVILSHLLAPYAGAALLASPIWIWLARVARG